LGVLNELSWNTVDKQKGGSRRKEEKSKIWKFETGITSLRSKTLKIRPEKKNKWGILYMTEQATS
jgi:hypothetical protein